MEQRLWILIIVVGTLLVFLYTTGDFHDRIRTSLFQVVSIATSTGFATRGIADPFFGSLAKQVFLILMVIGGCVGSTAGGVKVLRIGVMGKLAWHQLKLVSRPSREVVPFVIDGELVRPEEVQRTAAIFFVWVGLLALGSLITGLLTGFSPLESLSGIASALGNVGPTYIDPQAFIAISPAVKVFYIMMMVGGRLEILPLLLIFSRRVWR